MNLEDYGVIELHNDECQSINGGSWLSYAVGYVCGKIVNLLDSHEAKLPANYDPLYYNGGVRGSSIM